MAGGGVSVGEGVLYSYVVVPLANAGELAILKYDQIVHFYGFGVATLAMAHFAAQLSGARRHQDDLCFRYSRRHGLGALNELIEFTAVLAFPDQCWRLFQHSARFGVQYAGRADRRGFSVGYDGSGT